MQGINVHVVARFLIESGMGPVEWGLHWPIPEDFLSPITQRCAGNRDCWEAIRSAVVMERAHTHRIISMRESLLSVEKRRAEIVAEERREFEVSIADQHRRETERRSMLTADELLNDITFEDNVNEAELVDSWLADRAVSYAFRRSSRIRSNFYRGWKGPVEDMSLHDRYVGGDVSISIRARARYEDGDDNGAA